ncbi:cellular tumor antigen p53 [Musca vetustissima]|uniref:cellular tumor antigen p53 n=1 Tax=Musca vetustissima TaxID=27455 RepID=UPI002AB7AFBA|nr:cellular tumor antigen p53 [Musca vetustissima]
MKLLTFQKWRQSEIMNLMEQMVDPKMNYNSIPVCEEHDNGGYDFRIQVNTTENTSRYVIFSQDSQRLYVKPHENVTIDCFYKVKMPIQPLNVRITPIYSTDTSDPVRRCQNHISKDNEPNELIRNSLLRCENLGAVYHGSDTGKSIRDRYSVVVPLNAAVKAGDNGIHLKQQLIIHFTCNNSCMNRKPTSVLFLLETNSGDILAQRLLTVKISTCPKRDQKLYERPSGSKRRPVGDPDFSTTERKIPKYDDTCVKDEFSRSSYGDPSDDDTNGGGNNMTNGADCGESNVDVVLDHKTGEYKLTLKYKTRHQMLEVLRLLYSNAVSNEVFYKTAVNGKRTRDTEHLKRCYEKTLRLKLD